MEYFSRIYQLTRELSHKKHVYSRVIGWQMSSFSKKILKWILSALGKYSEKGRLLL